MLSLVGFGSRNWANQTFQIEDGSLTPWPLVTSQQQYKQDSRHLDFQEMAPKWWIKAVWLWMDVEHLALPMEGIEHPLNTIRASKGTFKLNILIVK